MQEEGEEMGARGDGRSTGVRGPGASTRQIKAQHANLFFLPLLSSLNEASFLFPLLFSPTYLSFPPHRTFAVRSAVKQRLILALRGPLTGWAHHLVPPLFARADGVFATKHTSAHGRGVKKRRLTSLAERTTHNSSVIHTAAGPSGTEPSAPGTYLFVSCAIPCLTVDRTVPSTVIGG